MIQRVQSVYLLLVTVLMSFMLILPYAELTLTDGQSLDLSLLMGSKVYSREKLRNI